MSSHVIERQRRLPRPTGKQWLVIAAIARLGGALVSANLFLMTGNTMHIAFGGVALGSALVFFGLHRAQSDPPLLGVRLAQFVAILDALSIALHAVGL